MAFNEIQGLRQLRSRTYFDTVTRRRRFVGTPAPLHYESTLDTGNFVTPIDMTPQRIITTPFDGWRVTSADWSYFLGQPQGKADGWVGFGGRKGQNVFSFRLVRAGYLHGPTRVWTDIDGTPTYNRANLSRTTNTRLFGPNAEALPIETVATWTGIWSTPSAGDVTVRWRADGDRLKEEIILNQAGRDWIRINRPPATPLNETWFGFTFALDWTDVPKIVRSGVEQDPASADFADDGVSIELRDAASRLLALLPLDEVRVQVSNPHRTATNTAALRKRFWHDSDGNHYLAVGVRCDTLNAMDTGALVFDPTVSVRVGASTDDCDTFGSTMDLTSTVIFVNYPDTTESDGVRFLNVTIPQAATINAATVTFRATNTNSATGNVVVKGEAADNAATYSTFANYTGRALTTGTVNWVVTNGTWNSGADEVTPSLVTLIQEIVNRAGWASGNALALRFSAHPTLGNTDARAHSYDGSTTLAPLLDVTYTAAGATAYPFKNRPLRGLIVR